MATPQYIKNAQNNYNSKFDLVQLKLPKGTKERIKAILEDGQSIAGYCVQSVLAALESDEEYAQAAEDAPETFQNAQKSAEPERPNKLPETPKADTRTETEQLAEWQAILDAKKAELQEQKRCKEEENAREEQDRAEELKNYVRKMKADSERRKKEQAERFSQHTDEEIKAFFCGDDLEFRNAIANPANKDAYINEVGEENYNRCLKILEEVEKEEKEKRRTEKIAAAKFAENSK